MPKPATLATLLLMPLSVAALWGASTAGLFSTSDPQLEALAGPQTQTSYTPQQEGGSDSFALIELFTSEGCSSCPSADRNLEQIAAQARASGKNVYTLSYHVDYWNYLGWSDPYSSRKFSDRQRRYATQFNSDSVYTPQMVVNGKAEFVGSNQKKSQRAIELALQNRVTASVAANAFVQSNQIKVDWQAQGLKANEAINVALVQNSGKQDVNRGENARRKLTHVNIVRELKTVGPGGTQGSVQFAIPSKFKTDDFHVVIFSQADSAVTAAAQAKIKSSNSPANKKLLQRSKPLTGKTLFAVQSTDSSPHHASLRTLPTAAQPFSPQSTDRPLVSEKRFLEMLSRDPVLLTNNLRAADQNWSATYVPMILEVARFLPAAPRSQVMSLLEAKTGQRFGRDFDRWFQWTWKQKFALHPGYANFKSELYERIDPRFAEYFASPDNPKIRLDEIRWGGVVRDGIPPLKNPEMLPAAAANYLADSDVVFGIQLNGDARAYPKRILAWHEMFKDTIGGQSVCGVY